ncbi:DUF192 domain-containing protein [Patescibacteria group bacterium]|nr:DUF192 domain-containing protein [Patescibacteria group bacterium]MCL5409887.1 DUF192 domain-containing protein [Patescibacteria group bacterium]
MVKIKVRFYSSFKQRAWGLIGAKIPENALFTTRFGIHTFGLQFPIDVLVLDENYTVRKSQENLLPNKLFFWNPKFSMVLELPGQTLRNLDLQQGDQVDLEIVE